LIRDSLQMIIFVNDCSAWSIVHIKNAFWYVNKKKYSIWCKFVSLFLFNNAYGLPVLTMGTKYPNQVFYIYWWIYWLFVLNTTLKHNSIQMMIFVNLYSKWSMVYIKDAFWYVSNKKLRKWCLFHISHLITFMAYLFSHLTPNVQIEYFVWLVDLQSIWAK
jgi:hypothetical protein